MMCLGLTRIKDTLSMPSHYVQLYKNMVSVNEMPIKCKVLERSQDQHTFSTQRYYVCNDYGGIHKLDKKPALKFTVWGSLSGAEFSNDGGDWRNHVYLFSPTMHLSSAPGSLWTDHAVSSRDTLRLTARKVYAPHPRARREINTGNKTSPWFFFMKTQFLTPCASYPESWSPGVPALGNLKRDVPEGWPSCSEKVWVWVQDHSWISKC